MTHSIIRVDPVDAWNLMYQDNLAMLPELEQEAMHRAIRNSTRIWVGTGDSEIVAMWGLIPPTLMGDAAYLWLYTTKHLQEHTFVFIRHSQRAVQEMLTYYPTIIGHTLTVNHRAIQWLRWLGAEFGDPVHDKALPFTIRAKHHQ